MVSSCLCPYFLAGVFCDNLNQCDGATVDLIRWGASLSRSHFVWRLSQGYGVLSQISLALGFCGDASLQTVVILLLGV